MICDTVSFARPKSMIWVSFAGAQGVTEASLPSIVRHMAPSLVDSLVPVGVRCSSHFCSGGTDALAPKAHFPTNSDPTRGAASAVAIDAETPA